MTTEIAILNRSAVALAADSAVTVSGRGGIKVYDGVNKLFELVRGRPVGVMIYNSADLSLRPWETIIKSYREERKLCSFPTLDEYVSDFKEFIQTHAALFSRRQQREALASLIDSDLSMVRAYIGRAILAKVRSGNAPTTQQVSRIVNREVREFWEYARASYALDQWDRPLPSLRTLSAELRDLLDERIDIVFENLPLNDAVRARLRIALIHRSLGFAGEDDDEEFSGVVFAGFGDDEYYPRLREFRTKVVYNDRLLCREIEDSKSDIGVDLPGDVKSFAQGDMIRSFTDGIQDQVRSEMVMYWARWRSGGVGAAVTGDSALGSLSKAEKKAIAKVVDSQAITWVDDFLAHMAAYERANVRGPLLQSVSYLPKDEMGAMAESLVNLTTLKRRVSINEAQTVGGAVDVAVVSRGDGFVWLKRKHYFSQNLNPSWAATHAATPARQDED
ncbi:MAG: hypothetical protein U0R78_15710 [Nocardioidaceae bacterium]